MRAISLLAMLVIFTGCKKEEVPSESSRVAPAPSVPARTEPSRSEVKVGGSPDDDPQLEFRITASYANQQPTNKAPWHRDGGDWTFFDAQTNDKQPASFLFGFRSKGAGNAPFAFGDALLVMADGASAARFLDQFGKAFHQTVPPAGRKHASAPLRLALAVLGRNTGRQPSGGFSGDGDWTATKLFPQSEGHEGEVFFNFSLSAKKGEFAEKDADYDKDVMAVFSAGLR
jgi:hypothetical protein